MKTLLKEATLITPYHKETHHLQTDLIIENGTIVKIGKQLPITKDIQVIDLPNLHVSSGWFDSSVAFGEPGYEQRETLAHGLKTAGLSGFTQVALMPNTYPLPNSGSWVSLVKEQNSKSCAQASVIGNLTHDQHGKDLAELYDLYLAGVIGFYDYKKGIENANMLKIALQYTQNIPARVWSFPSEASLANHGMVHEGTTSTSLGLKGIPAMAEEIRIQRDLEILRYTQGRLHIPTISTKKSVELIKQAKQEGLDVSCSVSIHHLFLTDQKLINFDTRYKILPPLRTPSDIEALQTAVLDHTIDFVTSDHCPLDIEEKKKEFDLAEFGSIGLENVFGLLNLHFGLDNAIKILTGNKEKMGLNSTSVKEGQIANLSLFDPNYSYVFDKVNILSTSKNSSFLGEAHKGKVYGIINGNKKLIGE